MVLVTATAAAIYRSSTGRRLHRKRRLPGHHDRRRSVTAHFSRILGDVNLDGEVDSGDALIILSCDAGVDTSGFCPMNCGDVNSDGFINSTDALVILTYDAEIAVPYPVGGPGCPASVTPCPGCGTLSRVLGTGPVLPNAGQAPWPAYLSTELKAPHSSGGI